MIEACYKLTFHGALHVDGRGTAFYEQAETFVRSDTLSAAIAATWIRLYPDDADCLFEQMPYLLTSAFPFYQDMLFFPRSVGSKAIPLPEHELSRAKSLKKAQWLEASLWRQAVNHEENWYQHGDIADGGLMTPKDKKVEGALWHIEDKPRIAVDRGGNHAADGLIFNFSRVHYHPDGGLFFLAMFDDEINVKRFESVLSLLGDNGLGSDRSNGHGHFTFKKTSMPSLKLDKQVCLSLLNPCDADMDEHWLDNAAYDLVRRGGWIGGSSWRKQSIRMFTEGSSFSKPLQGRMVKVGEHPVAGHPVYRDGRAFMVGGDACS